MNHPSEQVSFGEFQLDLRTRELQRNGDTVDLQEQPFLVLTTFSSSLGNS